MLAAGAVGAGVVDRVGDQVAHDPLDPAYVGLGQARVVGRLRRRPRTLRCSASGRVASTTRWATSTRLTSSSSRTAAPGVEPADLEQVGEQRLEAVELGLQQLGGPGRRRVEVAAGVVQHVAGHPHGGQRRAQLVGDVGDEPALHPAELLELADLALQVGGHLVERRREPGQVVLAGDPQPLLQPTGREPLGDPARHPDRRDDLAGDQPGQPGDQDQQQHRRR